MQGKLIDLTPRIHIVPKNCVANLCFDFDRFDFVAFVITTSQYLTPFISFWSRHIWKYSGCPDTVSEKINEKRSVTIPRNLKLHVLVIRFNPVIMFSELLALGISISSVWWQYTRAPDNLEVFKVTDRYVYLEFRRASLDATDNNFAIICRWN